MLTRPSFWLCAALTAATWGAALALLVAPVQPQPTPQTAAAPADAREQFAFDLLAQLGNTQPSADTVAFVVEWTLAEDSSSGALARNNPLNTTKCGYNQVSAINGDGACGVARYATWQDGLDATVATLAQSNFRAIAYALQANDAVGAFNALIASDWAASHYGGGADWPKVQPRQGSAMPDDVRAALVSYALSLQGMPYVRGGRSIDGGDCSGTMQFIYKQIAGIDIGDDTFSQWPRLQPIDPSQLQPGDLWYGVFPDDEHTGMLADVDGDGKWDLIHNGADAGYLHVTYDFGSTYLAEHTKGYRRAL